MPVAININDLPDRAANRDQSIALDFATEEEAVSGIDNVKVMNPAVTKQAIVANSLDKVTDLGILTEDTIINPDESLYFTLTPGDDIILTLSTPKDDYRSIDLFVTNGSSYTITWPDNINWDDGYSLAQYGINIIELTTADKGISWLGDIIYSYVESNPYIGREIEDEWLDTGKVRFTTLP